jgi:hypothetical protein
VEKVPGVTTSKIMPNGPSNYAPQLRIAFDPKQLGATGNELAAALLNGEPRVVIHFDERSLTVMPYMMMPGDDRIAAEKVSAILRNPPKRESQEARSTGAPLGGQWDVHLEFVRGEADHILTLEEDGGKVRGQHRGTFLTGDVRGAREGDRVRLRSSQAYEGTSVSYTFEGVVGSGTITGTADVGEYGKAKFTATRHRS